MFHNDILNPSDFVFHTFTWKDFWEAGQFVMFEAELQEGAKWQNTKWTSGEGLRASTCKKNRRSGSNFNGTASVKLFRDNKALCGQQHQEHKTGTFSPGVSSNRLLQNNMFNGSADIESESATSLKFCKIQGNFAQLWRKLRYFFIAANLRQKFVHSGPAGIAATVHCSIIV